MGAGRSGGGIGPSRTCGDGGDVCRELWRRIRRAKGDARRRAGDARGAERPASQRRGGQARRLFFLFPERLAGTGAIAQARCAGVHDHAALRRPAGGPPAETARRALRALVHGSLSGGAVRARNPAALESAGAPPAEIRAHRARPRGGRRRARIRHGGAARRLRRPPHRGNPLLERIRRHSRAVDRGARIASGARLGRRRNHSAL